jgi:hypothetical protein
MSPTAVLILHTQGYVPYDREFLALGRKIDICKLIYRYLLVFDR